jgi:hypothetical protein
MIWESTYDGECIAYHSITYHAWHSTAYHGTLLWVLHSIYPESRVQSTEYAFMYPYHPAYEVHTYVHTVRRHTLSETHTTGQTEI